MEKIKIVSPWINFYHEVTALFRADPDVDVKFNDEDDYEIKLFVKDPMKAEALEYILPKERIFGNVTVKVTVIPANKPISSIEEALRYGFKDNLIFNYSRTESTPIGEFNYAVFRPEIVQYFNDDISDIDGKRTATAEQIAKEVLTLGDNWHICSSMDFRSRVNMSEENMPF